MARDVARLPTAISISLSRVFCLYRNVEKYADMMLKMEEAKEKQEKLVKTATCDTPVPGNHLELAMERTTAQASWTKNRLFFISSNSMDSWQLLSQQLRSCRYRESFIDDSRLLF